MFDLQTWNEAQLDRLLRHRERAGDHRLRRDHRRRRRQQHQRQPPSVGGEHVERAFQRRPSDPRQQRTLPHIVHHQRGQHEEQPRYADRVASEMSHVGIERFRPGHRKDHRSECEKGADRIEQKEFDRIMW